jgi:ribosome maturation protein SDO1
MAEKYTTARMTLSGEHFEILVKPDDALEFKMGKPIGISHILVVDTIFSDASKGQRASMENLEKIFKTTDSFKIAETILKRGELQLTTEQRHGLVEEKRKQVVNFIARHCIDPRTGFPHPPLRIEQAMSQVRLVIDPFKSGEEQARMVIDELRSILPLKIEQMRIAVKIPPEYAARTLGVAKNFGIIKQEEWQRDGSWVAVIEMAAGLHSDFLEKIGKITQGNYQTKILR